MPQAPQLAHGLERRSVVRRVVRVRVGDDGLGDVVAPDDLARRPQHHLRHRRQDQRGAHAELGTTEFSQRRYLPLQVVAGERQVPGFLGDVDAHDALEERVNRPPRAQLAALHVVDRVFAAQHEQEEQRREPPAEADDEPGPDAVEAVQSILLEHQGVLGLLDDLVVGVTELR